MNEFSECWRLPGAQAIIQEWRSDLSTIKASCSCPGQYHRIWSVIKLAGRHLGLYWDAELIRTIAAPMLATRSQVLIAGSADRSTLRLLADIGKCGAPHDFALVDRCFAPLRLAQDEAVQSNLALKTLQQDLSEPIVLPRPADLIFGHYVLNFFDRPHLRDALLSLKSVLAPGGKMIVAHRSGFAVRALSDEEWLALTRARIAQALPADSPDWPLIDDLLLGYAPHRGIRAMLPFADFEAEVVNCGLAVVAIHKTSRENSRTTEHKMDIPEDGANLYVLGHA